MPEKGSESLSVREACILLGVGLSRLYALLWSGQLAGTKQDGVWRIPRAAVEERKAEQQR